MQNPFEKAAANIIAECKGYYAFYHPSGAQLEFGDGAQKNKATWIIQVRSEEAQFIPTVFRLSGFKESSARYEFLGSNQVRKSGIKDFDDKGAIMWNEVTARLMRSSSEDDIEELETIRDIVAVIHSKLRD